LPTTFAVAKSGHLLSSKNSNPSTMRFNPLSNPILTPGQARVVSTFKPDKTEKPEVLPREAPTSALQRSRDSVPAQRRSVQSTDILTSFAKVPDGTLAFMLVQSAGRAADLGKCAAAVAKVREEFAAWITARAANGRSSFTDWRPAFTSFATGYVLERSVEVAARKPITKTQTTFRPPPAGLPAHTLTLPSSRWLARLRNRQVALT
jgi:hypothetical protein